LGGEIFVSFVAGSCSFCAPDRYGAASTLKQRKLAIGHSQPVFFNIYFGQVEAFYLSEKVVRIIGAVLLVSASGPWMV